MGSVHDVYRSEKRFFFCFMPEKHRSQEIELFIWTDGNAAGRMILVKKHAEAEGYMQDICHR